MIDRIKELMELSDSSPAQFAGAIGINRSNLTHLFSGRNQPSLDLARKILLAFPEVKTEWLIMGVGPMTKTDAEKLQPPIQIVPTEPDLFSPRVNTDSKPVSTQDTQVETLINEVSSSFVEKKSTNSNEREIKNEGGSPKRDQIFNSQRGKKIEKIIFFYTDKSFEIYNNE